MEIMETTVIIKDDTRHINLVLGSRLHRGKV